MSYLCVPPTPASFCFFRLISIDVILGALIRRHLPLDQLLGKEFEEWFISLVCQRKEALADDVGKGKPLGSGVLLQVGYRRV